jgi:hypothetical protein
MCTSAGGFLLVGLLVDIRHCIWEVVLFFELDGVDMDFAVQC